MSRFTVGIFFGLGIVWPTQNDQNTCKKFSGGNFFKNAQIVEIYY